MANKSEAFASRASDPIADMRRAVELIEREGLRPRAQTLLLPAWLPQRMLEWAQDRYANAVCVLGIGRDENGNPRTDGILWSGRHGRRSKKRRNLLIIAERGPSEIVEYQRAVDRQKAGEDIGKVLGCS